MKNFLKKIGLKKVVIAFVALAILGGALAASAADVNPVTSAIWRRVANDMYTVPAGQNIHVGGCYIGNGTGSPCGGIPGAAVWGMITGTLSNQTDLQNALNAKLGKALTTKHIFVGDGSNVATDAGTGLLYDSTDGLLTIDSGANYNPLTINSSVNTTLGITSSAGQAILKCIPSLGSDCKIGYFGNLVIGESGSVGGAITDLATLDSTGNLQLNSYPNTRDDTLSFTPTSFIYTDASGNVLEAPLSAIPVTPTGTPTEVTYFDSSTGHLTSDSGFTRDNGLAGNPTTLTSNDGTISTSTLWNSSMIQTTAEDIAGTYLAQVTTNSTGTTIQSFSSTGGNYLLNLLGASGLSFTNNTTGHTYTFPTDFTDPTDNGKTFILDSSTGQLSWGNPVASSVPLTSTQVAYGDAGNLITSDSGFTRDPASNYDTHINANNGGLGNTADFYLYGTGSAKFTFNTYDMLDLGNTTPGVLSFGDTGLVGYYSLDTGAGTHLFVGASLTLKDTTLHQYFQANDSANGGNVLEGDYNGTFSGMYSNLDYINGKYLLQKGLDNYLTIDPGAGNYVFGPNAVAGVSSGIWIDTNAGIISNKSAFGTNIIDQSGNVWAAFNSSGNGISQIGDISAAGNGSLATFSDIDQKFTWNKAVTFSALGGSGTQTVTVDNSGNLGTSPALLTVKCSISSAQILASHTTPITCIAAPGAGKAILPVQGMIKLTQTTPYSNVYTGLNLGDSNIFIDNGKLQTILTNATSDTYAYQVFPIATASSSTTFEDQPLTFSSIASDPTTGDGAVDLYITYQIISL